MMKPIVVAALAVIICTPDANGQSLLRRSDWQEPRIENYLPPMRVHIPWLEVDHLQRLKPYPFGPVLAPGDRIPFPTLDLPRNMEPRYPDTSRHIAGADAPGVEEEGS